MRNILQEKKVLEKGATMLEYSLLAALVGVASIASIQKVSTGSCVTFHLASCVMMEHGPTSSGKAVNRLNHCLTFGGHTKIINEKCGSKLKELK